MHNQPNKTTTRKPRLALAIGLAILSPLLTAPAGSTAAVADDSGTYVALGDSFSSGEGNPPYDAGTDRRGDKCHRSPRAYPHLLNSPRWPLGTESFDACSGADTTAIFSGSPGNHEGSQFDRLNAATTIVTLTAGGNNADFANTLRQCVYGPIVPGGSANCPQNLVANPAGGARITLHDREQTLIDGLAEDSPRGPSLHTLYQAIHDRAPHARIYVLLYPHLFNLTPGKARCDLYGTAKMHAFISQTNINWLNQTVDTADKKIEDEVAAVRQTGVNIEAVDPRPLFDNPSTTGGQGHGVCSTHGVWFNGLHIKGFDSAPESFHPNKQGQQAFADALQLAALVKLLVGVAVG
ncbi:SGNH/GDSL hydrolase family protein [Streptomyces sp. HUAS TT7]|uniref:SGNH/GDSL hydrolase family protein n=1 Tax=Streptomyces sp. HUAS TT7 TaxID=3447507 RepID=UPI003F654A90